MKNNITLPRMANMRMHSRWICNSLQHCIDIAYTRTRHTLLILRTPTCTCMSRWIFDFEFARANPGHLSLQIVQSM